jgi:hypothetical protein
MYTGGNDSKMSNDITTTIKSGSLQVSEEECRGCCWLLLGSFITGIVVGILICILLRIILL